MSVLEAVVTLNGAAEFDIYIEISLDSIAKLLCLSWLMVELLS